MTEAEQVACDALRSAGHEALADNLKFAAEAVRLRAQLVEMLECDVEGYCSACGVHAESETHRLSCRLVPLFSTQDGWAAKEMERAHAEALRQDRLRTPRLFDGVDAATYAMWRGDAVPQTPIGRVSAVSELVKSGYAYAIRPADFLDPKK